MPFIVRLLPTSRVRRQRTPDVSPGVHCQQFAFLALVAIALSGCQKPEEITRYTVARPPPRESGPDSSTVNSSEAERADGASKDAPDGQHQLLGAIVPHGKMTWFFKLTGTSQAVSAQTKPFSIFLGSIKFSE